MKWDRHSWAWAAGGVVYMVAGVILAIQTRSWLTTVFSVLFGLLWIVMAARTAWREGHRGVQ
jgi:hypothetical protein